MCAEGQTQSFTLVHCPSHHLFPFLAANGTCGITHSYLLVASYLEILNARQTGFLKGFQVFCYGFLVYQAVHPLPYYPRAVFVFWIKEIMIQFALCKCICRISKNQSDNKSGIVKFHNIFCFILFLQRYNIPTTNPNVFRKKWNICFLFLTLTPLAFIKLVHRLSCQPIVDSYASHILPGKYFNGEKNI